MWARTVAILLAGVVVSCGSPQTAAEKAAADAQTNDTLPPIVTHKGYKCIAAKSVPLNVPHTHTCTAGFSASSQVEPGYCQKSERKEDTCKTGYKFIHKIVVHYDINQYPDSGVPVCKHIEEDKGLKEVDDCR